MQSSWRKLVLLAAGGVAGCGVIMGSPSFLRPTTAIQAQEQTVWAATLKQAQRIAFERHRLVLIHFWSDNCPPCRSVERNVFSQPEVERALATNFVPVRVNVMDDPDLAQKLKIDRYPMDVVITPQGEEVYRTVSEQDPNKYIAFLDSVATHARVGMTPPRGAIEPNMSSETVGIRPDWQENEFVERRQRGPRGGEYTADSRSSMLTNSPEENRTFQPRGDYSNRPAEQDAPPDFRAERNFATPDRRDDRTYEQRWGGRDTDRFAADPNRGPAPQTERARQPQANPYSGEELVSSSPRDFQPRYQGERGEPASTSPPIFQPDPRERVTNDGSFNPPTRFQSPAARSGEKPAFALESYCPVTLIEQRKWRKGDARFGAVHRDRTYLFAGPDEQQRFLANPDRYSPMLSGYDPVVFAERGQMIEGRRQHGVTFGNEMYLFADEASLQRFWEQPQRYSRTAQQAMRGTSTGNVQR